MWVVSADTGLLSERRCRDRIKPREESQLQDTCGVVPAGTGATRRRNTSSHQLGQDRATAGRSTRSYDRPVASRKSSIESGTNPSSTTIGGHRLRFRKRTDVC